MKIKNPVFIIGSYRGGTSLLFRLLSESDELYSLYRESNHMWQDYHRHPTERSDTLVLEKNEEGIFVNQVNGQRFEDIKQIQKSFDNHYHYSAYSSYRLGYLGRVKFLRERFSWLLDLVNIFNYHWKNLFTNEYRFIDKTPPNMYRVGFLKALYPDAKFIYLIRNKEDNVNSLVKAWCHPKKFKYLYRKYLGEFDIKNYSQKLWKFFIPLDYQDWSSQKSIEEVCAHQYQDAHQAAERAFRLMAPEDYLRVEFEAILANPELEINKLCDFLDINYSKKIQNIVKEMPAVNTDKLASSRGGQ